MIHGEWDFTLNAVFHSVTAGVLTAKGDGKTLNGHFKVSFKWK